MRVCGARAAGTRMDAGLPGFPSKQTRRHLARPPIRRQAVSEALIALLMIRSRLDAAAATAPATRGHRRLPGRGVGASGVRAVDLEAVDRGLRRIARCAARQAHRVPPAHRCAGRHRSLAARPASGDGRGAIPGGGAGRDRAPQNPWSSLQSVGDAGDRRDGGGDGS